MINLDELKKAVEDKWVNVQKHPTHDLFIYNYSQKAQYDFKFDGIIALARGLILDKEGNVVARPFPKFFSYEQLNGVVPNLPFEVYDKKDGCFGSETKIDLWNGGTIPIGKVVREKLTPTLIGMDGDGNLVPSKVIDWHRNGKKDNWMGITVDFPIGFNNYPHEIRLTSNHHICINGEFIPAYLAKVGDSMTTFSNEPDEIIIHLIKSSLLGDGCIVYGNTKTKNTASYQEIHASKYMEYVEFLRNILGDFKVKAKDRISGYGSPVSWCRSKQSKSLKVLKDLWYLNGKKILPQDLSWIDDFSIAKWYMDDGSLSHNSFQKDRACFSTNTFTREEVERLSKILMNRYNISCKLQYSKGWTIRVNAGKEGTQIDAFWKKIVPHIIPSLRYKVPEQFRNLEYIPYPSGKMEKVKLNTTISNIREIPATKRNFPSGRIGYDISTETGNYFAKNLLVHNSLGILFHLPDGTMQIATRGSFTSEQAVRANEIAVRKYPNLSANICKDYTYLFEIIYKENRIVVDYGDREELVLLAIIETATGKEIPLPETFPTPIVKRYNFKEFGEILKIQDNDREGFVVRFTDGSRVKIKFENYVKLHRLIMGFRIEDFIDSLEKNDIEAVIDKLPDEWYDKLVLTKEYILSLYMEIEKKCLLEFKSFPTRKECAEYFNKCSYPSILFFMLDNRPYKELIWKILKKQSLKDIKNFWESNTL